MTLFCITNELDPEFRPCMKRDQHYAACDTYEYRYDPASGDYLATGKSCKGCVPKEAKVGLLCWSCWERLDTALAGWTIEFRALLRSVDRTVQPDNGGIRSASFGHIPLAGTALTLDEIWSYISGAPKDPSVWVCTPSGAINALRFSKAVRSALRAHEVAERPHRVQHVRCPKCERLSLLWNPPVDEDGFVHVTCQNEDCNHEFEQRDVEVEAIRQQGVTDPVIDEGGAPVTEVTPFDRDNPEHMALLKEPA